MATKTKKADSAEQADTSYAGTFEEALERGYFGSVPDPRPNSAYSLESGPDGVPLSEVNVELAEARRNEQAAVVAETQEN